ncbi:vacuolar sorting protein VPS33/slp1 [Irineochytrium annulatum]|nr:vacuolar sorting protein VPS33/slp1 [Irineochytrium annulatum]
MSDLATGETADGKSPRNIILDMGPLLDDPAVLAYDKLRLLILYIIAQEGIQDGDRRRLLEASKLSIEDAQAITNLNFLGLKLSTSTDKKKKNKEGKYTYYGRIAEKKKRRKKVDNELPYDLSRYVPMMKYLMEDGPPEDPSQTPKATTTKVTKSNNPLQPLPNASNPYSLRTTRPSWALKSKVSSSSKSGDANANSASAGDGEELRRNGPRIILFVMGGLTFSEIRASFEVMKDTKRDVIIGGWILSENVKFNKDAGSTAVINPTQFVSVLKEIHKTDGHAAIVQSLSSSLTNLVSDGAGATSPAAGESSKSTDKLNADTVKEKEKGGLKNIFKKK